MKYKRDKKLLDSIPEAARDWPVGAVCKTGSGRIVTYAGVKGGLCKIAHVYDDQGELDTFYFDDLTPIEAWIPKPGERVACWDNPGGRAVIREFAELPGPNSSRAYVIEPGPDSKARYRFISRIPNDLLLKDADMHADWWIANGEIYEAES